MAVAKLTSRQKKFADIYLEIWNATEAAKQAGYSPESAAVIGCQNLRKANIAEYIRARTCARDAETVANEPEVMTFLTSVVRGNVKDQFGLDPTLADRLRAAEGLMKRFAVGEERQQNALDKLDKLLEGIDNAAKPETESVLE